MKKAKTFKITDANKHWCLTINSELDPQLIEREQYRQSVHGYKIADIYDFLDNNFWSFFLKCYYSFIILSTPIILCIIYQSETLIKFDLINVILFSFINLVFIIIYVIIFYSMYEIPLKKIFKSFLVKEDILSDNADDDDSILLD